MIKNIKLNKEYNIRTLSNIKNKDNLTIKDNSFIRGSNLEDLTQEEINTLIKEYKIKTIIDLRNTFERGDKYLINKNVKYINIPILKGHKQGITESKNKALVTKVPNIYESYKDIVSDKNSKKQINKVLKVIMNPKNKTVLFHCKYGKDRTGIIALFVLTMLDVDIDTIKNDYLYSNKIAKKKADNMYEYYLEKTRNEDFAGRMKEIFLAKEEYLDYIINYMENKRGSIIDYIIKDIKISKRRINKFKEEFLKK